MKDFSIIEIGLVFASVCTSLSVEETTDRLNAEHPTGIESRWSLHYAGFKTGEDNPCPCDRSPETHKHMLFSC